MCSTTRSSQSILPYPALVDEQGETGGSEGLAGRSGLKERRAVHPGGLTEFPDTVAAGERCRAVFDNGDGNAGHAEFLAQGFDASIEIVRGRRDCRGCGEPGCDDDKDGISGHGNSPASTRPPAAVSCPLRGIA